MVIRSLKRNIFHSPILNLHSDHDVISIKNSYYKRIELRASVMRNRCMSCNIMLGHEKFGRVSPKVNVFSSYCSGLVQDKQV